MPYCFSRSYVKLQGHTAKKIVDFDPNWAFPDCHSSLNSQMATKWCTKLEVALKRCPIVFSCDQAALWMVFSVLLSVCHTFFTMFPSSYHHAIFRSYYQWPKWCPCKGSRSEVKVTEVTIQLNRFRTVIPVWIRIWWNDTYSLMLLRRGALLFFKVIRQISRSHGSKNHQIWPKLGVSGL